MPAIGGPPEEIRKRNCVCGISVRGSIDPPINLHANDRREGKLHSVIRNETKKLKTPILDC